MTHSVDGFSDESNPSTSAAVAHVAALYGPNFAEVVNFLNYLDTIDPSQRKAIAARAEEYVRPPAAAPAPAGAGAQAGLGGLLGLLGGSLGGNAEAAKSFPLKDAEDRARGAADKANRGKQLGFATNAALTIFAEDTATDQTAQPGQGGQSLQSMLTAIQSAPSYRVVADAVSSLVLRDLVGTSEYTENDAALLIEPFTLAVGGPK